jgi:hypothetical protein
MPKSIALEWAGKKFTILESEAFAVGELVEDIITLGELPDLAKRPKFHKIARVYGEMLRFAGAKVTDQEIHSAMMAQVKAAGGGDDGAQIIAGAAISALVEILMDGAPQDDEGDTEKKSAAS